MQFILRVFFVDKQIAQFKIRDKEESLGQAYELLKDRLIYKSKIDSNIWYDLDIFSLLQKRNGLILVLA